jgi:hypothetical protein
MEDRTILLFGKSMLLTLVANSLAQNPNLHVIHETSWSEVAANAAGCHPDVLIYDLDSASESAILPMLYENPHLLLIGLDVETNRAVLIAGQETSSLTLERVKEIVESVTRLEP